MTSKPNEIFDCEKMEKLPAFARFFDLNLCWVPGHRIAVQALAKTSVTPNQVSLMGLIAGLAATALFLIPGYPGQCLAGLFLYLKLFLDNVDGNLARVKNSVSRVGRFLDSFADFTVALGVYLALSVRLSVEHQDLFWLALGTLALLSSYLQCSYWVYYYVSYTDEIGTYKTNRRDESLTKEDQIGDQEGEKKVYLLQRFHNLAYGWQDRLIEQLDGLSIKLASVNKTDASEREAWYADKAFLTGMGPLCICTNTALMVLFTLFDKLEYFFPFIIFAMNAYWLPLHIWKIWKFRKETVKKGQQID